jgi:hypothetical protein
MPIKIYKEKMEYLKKMLQELPQKTDPKGLSLYSQRYDYLG